MNWFAPNITDDDIMWAAQTLGLPENAFGSVGSDDERRSVFKELQNIDVAACPGSGKTTLLVAKLAVLAQKWTSRSHGICVLSHTNVARNEVHERLGGTLAGKRLLSYPHFIGTIHSFTNDFLAFPWLRSNGHTIKRIETDSCLKKRWASLKPPTRTVLEHQKHKPSLLQCRTIDYDLGAIRWSKKATLSKETDTYRDMQRVCKQSVARGEFTYEEMFVWANHLLDSRSSVREAIQGRFPIVFIDEAQDNSEIQSAILHRLFSSPSTKTVLQRFGDSNQAIYDSSTVTEAQTDPFPIASYKRELKRSHRFGKVIATLASPLGVDYQLIDGSGPKEVANQLSTDSANTIFLFGSQRCDVVLTAFAELLCQHFGDDQLQNGTFSAVGQIHRHPEEENAAHHPKHIGNYWPAYRSDLCGTEPKPSTFLECIALARPIEGLPFDSAKGVEQIAQGFVMLLSLGTKVSPLTAQRRCHLNVLAALDGNPRLRKIYLYLVCRFALSAQPISEWCWKKIWSTAFLHVAAHIVGHLLTNRECIEFLGWAPQNQKLVGCLENPANVLLYPPQKPRLKIRLGSIHSVKGETHTATLVLETFWNDHNLECLLPWLRGKKVGGNGAGKQNINRLRLHFVAMTRPSNLLCLAMKRSSFLGGDGGLDQSMLTDLKAMGWNVVDLG